MRIVTKPEPHHHKRRQFFAIGAVLLFIFLLAPLLVSRQQAKAAAAPSLLTYQAKLLVNGLAATTTQSVYLVLYDALTSGNVLYTAGGTIGTPAAVSLTPSSGLFSVDLGGSGTNSLSPDIFANNNGVYLEVRVGSETLSPRKQISAAPYAFNARYLDGVAPTSTASSSVYIPVSDSQGNFSLNRVTSTGGYFTGLTTLTSGLISNASSSIGGTLSVSGAVTVSSTLLTTGLATLQSGFIANASSSIGGLLTVGSLLSQANFNASSSVFLSGVATSTISSFAVNPLATLLGGFISNASSSIGAGLQIAGALNASGTLQAAGLSTLAGFISSASSSISAPLTVTSLLSQGNLNVSSSVFLSGVATTTISSFAVQPTATLVGGFISNASSSIGAGLQVAGALSASGTLQVAGNTVLQGLTVTSCTGCGGGAAADWVKETNFGVLNLTASTTLPYWAKSDINASTSIRIGNGTVSSTLNGQYFAQTDGTSSTVHTPTSFILGQRGSGFNQGVFYINGATGGDGSVFASGSLFINNGATGAPNVGNTVNISGAGRRLMWVPDKAAFRAGYVSGVAWDEANVGLYSVGLGKDTRAAGQGAVAIGDTNVVTQNGGIAIGANNTVGGLYASALGYGMTVNGEGSFGIGLDTSSFFTISQTRAMAIMGGNVGVGTVAPGYTLSVTGTLGVSGTSTFGGDILPQGSITTSSVATSLTTIDSSGDVGSHLSAAIGADGNPIISYYDVSNGNLNVKHCTNPTCTASDAAVALDSANNVGTYTDLIIGLDGNPIITYRDETNSRIKIYKCTSPGCSSGYVASTTAYNATSTSMVLGGDGFPMIGFLGGNRNNVTMIHCTTQDCSESDISTPEASGATGPPILGRLKNGLIFYVWEWLGTSYFDVCNNAACTGQTGSFSIMDGDVSDGRLPAIAVPPDGRPVIAFYDRAGNNINMYRCGDQNCTGLTVTYPVMGLSLTDPYLSVAIGSHGFPIVSYLENVGGTTIDPVFFSCLGPNCAKATDHDRVNFDATGSKYATSTKVLVAKDGTALAFYYNQTDGNLVVGRTCANGSCAASSSLAGVSLGTAGKSFYRMYSKELYAQQAYLAGFDVAEAYPTADPSLAAGDLAAFDPARPGHVIKADSQAGAVLIGVVSTKPGLYLSEWTPEDAPWHTVPIALAGRVPLTVSTENGPIAIGDELTLSALPGVAMKALKGGAATIGRALEAFDGSTASSTAGMPAINNQNATSTVASSSTVMVGQITVFVQMGVKGESDALEKINWDHIIVGKQATSSYTESLPRPDRPAVKLSATERVVGALVDGLRELGVVIERSFVFIKDLITDRISTKELCVGATCVTEAEFKSLLEKNNIVPVPATPNPITKPEDHPQNLPAVTPTTTPPLDGAPSGAGPAPNSPAPAEPSAVPTPIEPEPPGVSPAPAPLLDQPDAPPAPVEQPPAEAPPAPALAEPTPQPQPEAGPPLAEAPQANPEPEPAPQPAPQANPEPAPAPAPIDNGGVTP